MKPRWQRELRALEGGPAPEVFEKAKRGPAFADEIAEPRIPGRFTRVAMAAVALAVFAAAAVLIWVAFEGTGQNLGKTPIVGSRAGTAPSEPKHPNLVGSPDQVASGSGWTFAVQHTDPGDFAMVMIAGEAQIVSYVQSTEELSGTRCGLAAVRVDDHFVWYGLVGPQIDELRIDLDNGTSSTSNKPVALPRGYDTDYRAIVAELPAGTQAVDVTEIRSDGSAVSATDCHPSGRS